MLTIGNWTSRRALTSDGRSYFEIEPQSGNRGNFLLHLVAAYGEDNRFFPRYFFDARSASSEAEAYLVRHCVDSYTQRLPIQYSHIVDRLEGFDCTTTIVQIPPYDGHRCPVGDYALVVSLHQEKKDVFVVDSNDLFPRLFFDLSIAKAEMWTWMRNRDQI